MTLRGLRADDVDAVHEWARVPEVSRFQVWGPNSEAETQIFMDEALAAARQRPQQRWVHAVEHEGTVVGSCELSLCSSSTGEIGYVIDPRWWGRGLATAAATQLVGLAFAHHGLHRVRATCDPRNVASAAVLRRVGMTYEGRMRETELLRDGWRDSDLYAVLAQEWPSAEAR